MRFFYLITDRVSVGLFTLREERTFKELDRHNNIQIKIALSMD